MNNGQFTSITLAFFSGTGCTKAVVDCFEKQLSELGIVVKTIDISQNESGTLSERNASDLLVVFSPVYAFRLTDMVETWMKALPSSEHTPVAIISVSGGGEISPNTACRVAAKRILRKKKYRVIYEKMIVMPSNFAVTTQENLAANLIQILPVKVRKIIDDLLAGREHLTQPKVQDRMFAFLGNAEHFGAKVFGASIHASDACNQCSLCIKHCPKKNIRLQYGALHFGFHCMFCMKCIYRCPTQALSPRFMKFAVLPNGFRLEHLQEIASQQRENTQEAHQAGPLWAGAIAYLNEEK